MDWLCNWPAWLVPKKLMTIAFCDKFTEKLRYGKIYAYEDLTNATKIYTGLNLAVSPKARGLGLGKKLIERSVADHLVATFL